MIYVFIQDCREKKDKNTENNHSFLFIHNINNKNNNTTKNNNILALQDNETKVRE